MNKSPGGILVEKTATTWTIRICNPMTANAITREMAKRINSLLRKAARSTRITHIVFRGLEGRECDGTDRHGRFSCCFGSGMDMREIAQVKSRAPQDEQMLLLERHCRQFADLLITMAHCGKCLIGVVYGGAAIGFSATLLLNCDIMIAAGDTFLVYPEKRANLAPFISAATMVRRFGLSAALLHFDRSAPVPVSEIPSSNEKVEICEKAEIEYRLTQVLKSFTSNGKKQAPKRHPKFETPDGDGLAVRICTLALLDHIGEYNSVALLSSRWLAEILCEILPEAFARMRQPASKNEDKGDGSVAADSLSP